MNDDLIKSGIEKIKNKDITFYFFVVNTNGNPVDWVGNVYEHAKVLSDLNYNVCILHEEKEFTSVEGWLGNEYAKLPHQPIKDNDVKINFWDFLIIPEIFSNLIEQTQNFPCKRIVFAQSHEYILEFLGVGKTWSQFKIKDVIVTNKKLGEYIKDLFPLVKTYYIPFGISSYFKDSGKPKKPIVGLYFKNPEQTIKLVKSFYLQYPMFRWISFVNLNGYDNLILSSVIEQNCLNVWVDENSTSGCFPLKSIKCNVPVIGKIPDMVPEWMIKEYDDNNLILKDNGIWTNKLIELPKLISEYLSLWLEDKVPEIIYNEMQYLQDKYTLEEEHNYIKDVYNNFIEERLKEINEIITKNKEVNNE